MSPEVLARKLARLREYLSDLAPYRGASLDEVLEEHYKVERLLELLVEVSVDMLAHELAERDVTPESYRGVFREAAEQSLLPGPLAGRLEDAAALRNVIIHLYEDLDYEIITASIAPALDDFGELLTIMESRLREMEAGA